jgi:hypothetical protein
MFKEKIERTSGPVYPAVEALTTKDGILSSLQSLKKTCDEHDLQLLGYLLSMAQEEAATIAIKEHRQSER